MATTETNCPGCGAPTSEDQNFCEHCRYDLRCKCAECGAPQPLGGIACPNCGTRREGSNETYTHTGEAVAYCPRCAQPHPLGAHFRYCPVTGEQIHLYLEINELALYMHNVSWQAQFRILPVHDRTIYILRAEVRLGGERLEPGEYDLLEPHPVRPSLRELRFDRLILPVRPQPEAGIRGVAEGNAVLQIDLEYEVGGKIYSLAGRKNINILPQDAPQLTIQNYIGARVSQTGEGPQSGGAHSTTANIDFSNLDVNVGAAAFIKKQLENVAPNYRPVRLRTALVQDDRRLRVVSEEAPAWAPMDRASLRFKHGEVEHNIVLLAKQGADFGRQKDCDVRYYDVELYEKRKRKISDSGDRPTGGFSIVGRRQWRFLVSEQGLEVEHICERNFSVLQGGKTIQFDGTRHRLSVGDEILLGDEIGLCLSHLDDQDEDAPVVREVIASYLKSINHEPSAIPLDSRSGATLTRIRSLTGEEVEDLPYVPWRETYVFVTPYASIGGRDTCAIQLPASAGQALGQIWSVGGYYFLRALSDGILVNGQTLWRNALFPLPPDADVRFEDFALTFKEFDQPYLTGSGG